VPSGRPKTYVDERQPPGIVGVEVTQMNTPSLVEVLATVLGPDMHDPNGVTIVVLRPARDTHAVGAPARPFAWRTLTEREATVASMVGQGLTNRQVASRMFISPHTVNYHLRQIFRKLSISSRVLLAPLAQAVPSGRVHPSPTDP
jgi:DNA-binding CsgD family transcriptional regulator